MTKQEVLPCNIESSETDGHIAVEILEDNTRYIVRYLRHEPMVGLTRIPARDKSGAVIEGEYVLKHDKDGYAIEGEHERKRVICSGIPYACMVAFMHQDKLLVGWSKRIETKRLLETHDLHALFRKVLEDSIAGVDEHSDNYKGAFDVFCQSLMNVLSYSPAKDVEAPFSKMAGKIAAIIRGLNDSISINGKNIVSAASGVVPNDIAKNLTWFVEQAEQVYGSEAANVGFTELTYDAAAPKSAVA